MFNKTKLGLVALSGAVFSGFASAELPAGVGTALTQVQTDGAALIDLAWPVLTAITVAFVVMKIFKKVVGRVV
jgi:hypothetical protein